MGRGEVGRGEERRGRGEGEEGERVEGTFFPTDQDLCIITIV